MLNRGLGEIIQIEDNSDTVLKKMLEETNQPEDISIEVSTLMLASSIKDKLCHNSPYLSGNCIFKVPEKLRRNRNVFDPNMVAIGPYHRNKPELAPMEKIKTWYLQQLLSRLPLPPDQSLQTFVKSIKKMVTSARRCYAEPIVQLNDQEFIEMLIVDGCFLIELFRKDTWSVQPHEDDPIFNTSWMHENLYRDLILLENQIPWAVLLHLFKLTEPSMLRNQQESEVLANLVLKFFETMMLMTEPVEYSASHHEIRHILDLLCTSLVSLSADKKPKTPQEEQKKEERKKKKEEEPKTPQPGNSNFEVFPPVTDLLKVGVRFKKGPPGELLNIKFDSGEFEIPPIKIRGNSEALFRNLIAYEQCYCDSTHKHKFTSYAALLDCLVNTSRDAELLCDKKIVVQSLSTEDVSLLLNGLYNDTLVNNFYYGGLAREINDYYRSRWRRWRSTLKNKYFNNPWSISSFIAAILILLFTFTQTLFSILSY